jgi:hypothetical protein
MASEAKSLAWPILPAAERLVAMLPPASLPHEILRLDADSAAIIVDIDGADYVLTMTRLTNQRERPLPA